MSTSTDAPAPRNTLRMVLVGVMALALMALGGGLAILLGLGEDDATQQPSAVDIGFSRDMAAHHLQAVEMSNAALEISEDPAVRGLAFDIGTTQTNQVGRMHGWLTLWGETVSGGEVMSWMGGHDMDEHAGHDMGGHGSGDGGALMPGMATDDELADLRTLSGTEFDVRFLQLMLRHHQGGLEMGEYGAEHAETDAVRDLARSIVQSQSAESDLMTDMITARGGTPLPAP